MARRARSRLSARYHRQILRTEQPCNLGRAKLADGLGLDLPASLEEEKTMWGLVTKYAYYADQHLGNALDAYRKAPAVESPQGSQDLQNSENSE